MNVFVGHTTAARFWRTAAQGTCDALAPSPAIPSDETARRAQHALLLLEGITSLDAPFHLDLPENAHEKARDAIIPHKVSEPLRGSYLLVKRDVFIASPELTFTQVANELSLEELIMFGNELCGTYVRDEFDPSGLSKRDPLCTVSSLARMITRRGSFRGKERAQKALACIVENTASPIESALCTRYALAQSYGGCGFRDLKSNFKIEIPTRFRHLTSKSYFLADLCWPNKRVILEYDSDLWHVGSEKIAQDTTRRNMLTTLGYTVIGVTRQHISNPKAMEQLDEEIARALGIRWRPRTRNYEIKRDALWKRILEWTYSDVRMH